MMLAVEFVGFFLFILVFGYIFPAGYFYYRYYVRKDPRKEELRIQQRQPTREQIWREVRMSVVTIAIFAIGSVVLFELYKAGYTNIYRPLTAWPLWYMPISFVLCLLAHDTFFYWSHRLMHWRPLFKYAHAGHHKSIAPTPWAIYAFQPLEAAIQFVGIMLIVVFIPMNIVTLVAFLWYDTLVNTAGHTGYEVVPEPVSRSWLYWPLNTVTHHDAHHTNMRKNFGSFFNVWDRLMGTFLDAKVPGAEASAERQPAGSAESILGVRRKQAAS